MRASLERFFLSEWQRASGWQILLRPLSWLFALLTALRRGLYQIGLLRTHHIGVPVVVVGNISVGGTGKTPVVLALVQALRARGFTPGIITRGYAASEGISDEAELLAKRSGAPLVADAARMRAAKALIAAHPQVDVIISDDGMQHYALARDVEIAVVDGARGVDNGYLLPAGPLRELPARLQGVDALVLNVENPNIHGHFQLKTPENARQMASFDISSMAGETPRYQMQYGLERFLALHDSNTLSAAAFISANSGKRIAAIAGIGHPPRFFAHLASLGIALSSTYAFPDHHAYSLADLAQIDADLILMTEKDAVKCHAFVGKLQAPLWQMQIDALLSDPFFDFIAAKIHNVTRSQTA